MQDAIELKYKLADCDAIINCYAKIQAETINILKKCKITARYGIDIDTIDLNAAGNKGIIVTNIPDYCIDEVSDHTLCLILALVRKIKLFYTYTTY